MGKGESGRSWFPFTSGELQAALGLFAFVVGGLAYAGVPESYLALGTIAYAVVVYLAGLSVHAARRARSLKLIREGGVGGRGYLELFRRARRSLLLMHVDDDAPCEELRALYRTLLDAGVAVRRTIVLREEGAPRGYEWIPEFGNHAYLDQRVLPPRFVSVLPMSFAIVDERTVVIAVPGYAAIDGESYSPGLMLRHLLVLEEPELAAAFVRMHEDFWRRSVPIPDARLLKDREQLLSSLV